LALVAVAITAPQFPILSPIGSPFLPVQPSSQSGRLIPGGFVYSSQGNRQNGSWPMLMNPMPYYPIDPRGIEESDLVKAGIQPNGSKKDFIIQILHDTGAQIDAIPANIYHDEIRDTNLLPRGTPPPPKINMSRVVAFADAQRMLLPAPPSPLRLRVHSS
jgi:hypothetical protein